MRIVVVTGPFLPAPPGPAGAVERLSSDLCRRFASEGHEVTLISSAFRAAPREETTEGVRHRIIPGFRSTGSSWLNLGLDLLYSRRVLRRLPPADLWSFNAFWLPRLALRRRPAGTAIVVNAHRFPRHQYGLYKGVDGIVAVSRSVAQGIVSQAPWTSNLLRVINNPIDTSHFRPAPCRGNQAPMILSTGRIHPDKGLALLVKACRSLLPRHPSLSLRLVGPSARHLGGGGDTFVSGLRQLAGPLPLSLPGPVYDREALADELRSATVCAFPLLSEQGEALPVAPMEAMACGMPVVLSRLSCFRDYATAGADCLDFDHLSPDPVAGLASALDQLLENPTLAARLGASAAAAMAPRDTSRVAAEYLSCFQALLRQSPRLPHPSSPFPQ